MTNDNPQLDPRLDAVLSALKQLDGPIHAAIFGDEQHMLVVTQGWTIQSLLATALVMLRAARTANSSARELSDDTSETLNDVIDILEDETGLPDSIAFVTNKTLPN